MRQQCDHCGAFISRYNPDPTSGLCSPCGAAGVIPSRPLREMTPDQVESAMLARLPTHLPGMTTSELRDAVGIEMRAEARARRAVRKLVSGGAILRAGAQFPARYVRVES